MRYTEFDFAFLLSRVFCFLFSSESFWQSNFNSHTNPRDGLSMKMMQGEMVPPYQIGMQRTRTPTLLYKLSWDPRTYSHFLHVWLRKWWHGPLQRRHCLGHVRGIVIACSADVMNVQYPDFPTSMAKVLVMWKANIQVLDQKLTAAVTCWLTKLSPCKIEQTLMTGKYLSMRQLRRRKRQRTTAACCHISLSLSLPNTNVNGPTNRVDPALGRLPVDSPLDSIQESCTVSLRAWTLLQLFYLTVGASWYWSGLANICKTLVFNE